MRRFLSPSLADPLQIPIAESSQVGEARRSTVALAQRLGFDETRRGQVAIVITELANNLLRHAGGGELIVRALMQDGADGLEILSIDRGPGLANIGQAMQDGFSTGGTTGTGLGAIRRLSNEFDLFSLRNAKAGNGTVLMCRIWPEEGAPPAAPGNISTGVVCLPNPGETVCGDAWGVYPLEDGRWFVIIADGLGHGLMAAEASRQAVRLFSDNISRLAGPADAFPPLHDGLRSTRGAAVSVAEINAARTSLAFAGIGNVSGMVVPVDGSPAKRTVCHNGTLGAQFRRAQAFSYPLMPRSLFIGFSDGLASHWELSEYPGLINRHPAVIAGVLYRDHRRKRDDVTVLVARVEEVNKT